MKARIAKLEAEVEALVRVATIGTVIVQNATQRRIEGAAIVFKFCV